MDCSQTIPHARPIALGLHPCHRRHHLGHRRRDGRSRHRRGLIGDLALTTNFARRGGLRWTRRPRRRPGPRVRREMRPAPPREGGQVAATREPSRAISRRDPGVR
ncbi:hypothetical protein ACRAWF_12365 [Streptomyces sp. L7]